MTTARTAEPPRLPVRDRATAHTRAWSGVSPMLARLATEQATGVLFREHGTLHLDEGLVVHAESPFAPGLDVLLTARGTLSVQDWQQALRETAEDQDTGRLLVEGGLLAPGTLELCRLASLYDAAYFALATSSAPGRFRYGTAHPGRPQRPVPVAALERETLRRRDLLHRIWPDPEPDTAPLIRADPVAAPALTRRQRTVLHQVDGARTASDIARTVGRLAFHTLVDVRRLTAAGFVETRREPPTPPPDLAQLSTDPHITLLKRLRDALEAL
ncbi:MAG: transcriptional regulator [Nonomuraea sp.]|nr:transcriptional regulator [Nonomuraea sp.]